MTAFPARGYAAIDLGASSGRVMLGVVTDTSVIVEELHRFANDLDLVDGVTVWDFPTLFEHTLTGLQHAVSRCMERGIPFAGIGVDSWGVDWAYLSPSGEVELPAAHYRDAPDPQAMIEARALTVEQTFALSGVADQAINSALRMGAQARTRTFRGEMPLFTPDLWIYWLTGHVGTDPTIASTSQLLDARTSLFSDELIGAVGIEGLSFPPVQAAGTRVAGTSAAITARIGSSAPIPVFRVAGHDTACAFAFADSGGDDALISSGTWSLVGAATRTPRTDEHARSLGFTNERGTSGTLLLRNLTGLWMLQECVREWHRDQTSTVSELLAAAERLPADDRVFDAADERLFAAGDMEARVRELCAAVGRPLDESRVSVLRAIIDSLAASYAISLDMLEQVTGRSFVRIRVVGGGSRNTALCQRTADLTGRTVIAGPVEATAIGNIAIQAYSDGAVREVADVYQRLSAETVTTFTPHPRGLPAS